MKINQQATPTYFLTVLLALFCIIQTRCVVGGAQCQNEAECPSHSPFCVEGTCLACRNDNDCPTGQHCTLVASQPVCISSSKTESSPIDASTPTEIVQTLDTPRPLDTKKQPDSQTEAQPPENHDTENKKETPTTEQKQEPTKEKQAETPREIECTSQNTKPCYTGPPNTADVGECQTGRLTCLDNRWSQRCVGEVKPRREVCDNKDNDCNGQIDETSPVEGLPCDTGEKGVCSIGKQTCSQGRNICRRTNNPTMEACDNKDNDCDGQIDEGTPGEGTNCNTGKLGECKTGMQTCSKGKYVCKGLKSPRSEVCDNKDNDCDGRIDEGNPGGGAYCNTGKLGECKTGIQTCSKGKYVCKGLKSPISEVCDGKDNNCNGQIDDNIASKTCYHSGAACQVGKSACTNGKVTCASHGTFPCSSNAACSPCGSAYTCRAVYPGVYICVK